jgi:hypothetical protein
MRSVAEQLDAATAEAANAGVRDVPAVLAAGRVFHGERTLPDALAALRAAPPQPAETRTESGPENPLTIHRSG